MNKPWIACRTTQRGLAARVIVNYYRRSAGQHWDGSKLTKDEIAELKRRPYVHTP